MLQNPLASIIERFKREPSRTGSLIITFYGDAIQPRGGSVWLGTLLAFFDMLDVGGNVVRTAMSRLAADGWLESEKVGRKSFYRLAPGGRARFENAIAHVYRPHAVEWMGRLELILIGSGMDRDAARAALSEAGYGSPMPGVWVAPAGVAVPAFAAEAIKLDVTADDETGRRLIGEAWPLEAIASAYRQFIVIFASLQTALASSAPLSPAEAIVARVLLIHQYRRVLLRDPLLPPSLLPADWPAPNARALCQNIYRHLVPASERWLDEFGQNATGRLNPPRADLAKRFQNSP